MTGKGRPSQPQRRLLAAAAALVYVIASQISPSWTAEAAWPMTRRGVAIGSCVFSACAAGACLQIVTAGNECLVERFGKYDRKLLPGWHFLFRPFEAVSFHATTREQVLDVAPQQCYTLDNAPIKADAVVYMRIVSTEAARYNVQAVHNAILNLCLTQLREEVGKLTLDESFSSRERINTALLRSLNSVCHQWGVEITRIELQNLEPSQVILAAMELQMAAERRKRAAILQSEGERTTMVNEAEGGASAALMAAEADRKSIVLAAEGEAERQRVEAKGIKDAVETVASAIAQRPGGPGAGAADKESIEAAVQFLSVIRYMEMNSKFASSDGTKVLMLPSKDR